MRAKDKITGGPGLSPTEKLFAEQDQQMEAELLAAYEAGQASAARGGYMYDPYSGDVPVEAIMAIDRQAIGNILSQLNPLDPEVRRQFGEAAAKEYGLGRDDYGKAYRNQRTMEGKAEEAPRGEQIFSTYPTSIRIEKFGMADPKAIQARQEMKMGLEPTLAGRGGQLTGAIAADITQDRGRSIYWL